MPRHLAQEAVNAAITIDAVTATLLERAHAYIRASREAALQNNGVMPAGFRGMTAADIVFYRSAMAIPESEAISMASIAVIESLFVRPNPILELALHRADPLTPETARDPDSVTCQCGECPEGVSNGRMCAFLVNYRVQQRMNRYQFAARGAIDHWSGTTSSARSTFGHRRG